MFINKFGNVNKRSGEHRGVTVERRKKTLTWSDNDLAYNADDSKIILLARPINAQDAVNKEYVDRIIMMRENRIMKKLDMNIGLSLNNVYNKIYKIDKELIRMRNLEKVIDGRFDKMSKEISKTDGEVTRMKNEAIASKFDEMTKKILKIDGELTRMNKEVIDVKFDKMSREISKIDGELSRMKKEIIDAKFDKMLNEISKINEELSLMKKKLQSDEKEKIATNHTIIEHPPVENIDEKTIARIMRSR